MKWEKVMIEEVLWFQEGPGVRNTQFQSSGIKLLNVGNINNNIVDLSTTKIFISEDEGYNKYKHFLVDDGDLLMASSGVTLDSFHKKIAFVNKEHLPLCMNTSTIRFKSKDKNICSLRFFSYYLRTDYFNKQLRKLITGSAQLNFGSSHLKQMFLPLPPIHIQEQIADILDKADSLRKKDQELLTKYDELAQTIFYDMFGDPVRNNKGWNVKTVIEVADCIVPGRDKPKSFTGNIPWVTTDDLKHLGTTNNSKKNIGLSDTEIKEVRAKIIPKNSVIMTCVGDLGIISIAGTDMVINQQLHAFQTKDINPTFLMYLLSLRKDFMIKMASSTTVPYMNKTVCNSIPVILPPKEMQEKFTSIYTGIKSQIDLSLKSFKNSTNLNEMLTVKYFS